jgi:hypothetical protein
MTMAGESSSVNSVSLCPAVQRFIELLEKRPLEFDVTILSDTASEHLVDTLVLQNDVILGVNALDVPRLARNVRQDYKASRDTNKILV